MIRIQVQKQIRRRARLEPAPAEAVRGYPELRARLGKALDDAAAEIDRALEEAAR